MSNTTKKSKTVKVPGAKTPIVGHSAAKTTPKVSGIKAPKGFGNPSTHKGLTKTVELQVATDKLGNITMEPKVSSEYGKHLLKYMEALYDNEVFPSYPTKTGFISNTVIKNMMFAENVEDKKDLAKEYYKHLGQKLQKIRQEAKVKQDDIAAAIGVAPTHVSIWENGGSKMPIYALCVYCDMCGISPEYVLDYHSNTTDFIMSLTNRSDINPACHPIFTAETEAKRVDIAIRELEERGYVVKAPEKVQEENIPKLVEVEFFNTDDLIKILARYPYQQQEIVKECVLQAVKNTGLQVDSHIQFKRRTMDDLGMNTTITVDFSSAEVLAIQSMWKRAKQKIRQKLEKNGKKYTEEFWYNI